VLLLITTFFGTAAHFFLLKFSRHGKRAVLLFEDKCVWQIKGQ